MHGIPARFLTLLAGLALLGAAPAVRAAPPASGAHADAARSDGNLPARIDAARIRNQALQARVTRMEQQDAARQDQLRQRDARIAALQRQLRAAGAPASAASTGP